MAFTYLKPFTSFMTQFPPNPLIIFLPPSFSTSLSLVPLITGNAVDCVIKIRCDPRSDSTLYLFITYPTSNLPITLIPSFLTLQPYTPFIHLSLYPSTLHPFTPQLSQLTFIPLSFSIQHEINHFELLLRAQGG